MKKRESREYVLADLGSYGGSLGCVKTNAVELDIRNLMRSSKHRGEKHHLGFCKPGTLSKNMSSGLEI